MILLILKYILWTLTNVLVIAGAWFVKFTEDGDDGRKRLTRWGRIGLPVACVCFVFALMITIHGDIVESRRQNVSDADKNKFSPKLEVFVVPVPFEEEDTIVVGDPVNSNYYGLGIRNLNDTSVPILNLVVTFWFNNSVVRLSGQPGIGALVISGIKVYNKTKAGNLELVVEGVPTELSIFNAFSLDVLKRKIEDRVLNTNTVMFSCSFWPSQSNIHFQGEIVTAPGGRIEVSTLGRPGTYQGQFFYEIKGQAFSEKLSGKIVRQQDLVQ